MGICCFETKRKIISSQKINNKNDASNPENNEGKNNNNNIIDNNELKSNDNNQILSKQNLSTFNISLKNTEKNDNQNQIREDIKENLNIYIDYLEEQNKDLDKKEINKNSKNQTLENLKIQEDINKDKDNEDSKKQNNKTKNKDLSNTNDKKDENKIENNSIQRPNIIPSSTFIKEPQQQQIQNSKIINQNISEFILNYSENNLQNNDIQNTGLNKENINKSNDSNTKDDRINQIPCENQNNISNNFKNAEKNKKLIESSNFFLLGSNNYAQKDIKNYEDFDINKKYFIACQYCKQCIPQIEEVNYDKEKNDFKISYICPCNISKNKTKKSDFIDLLVDYEPKNLCPNHNSNNLMNFCKDCNIQVCEKCIKENHSTHNRENISIISKENLQLFIKILNEKKEEFKGYELLEKILEIYSIKIKEIDNFEKEVIDNSSRSEGIENPSISFGYNNSFIN